MPVFQVILNNDDRDRFLNYMTKAPLGIRVTQVISNMGGNDYNAMMKIKQRSDYIKICVEH